MAEFLTRRKFTLYLNVYIFGDFSDVPPRLIRVPMFQIVCSLIYHTVTKVKVILASVVVCSLGDFRKIGQFSE